MIYTCFAIAVIESIWPNPDGSDYMGGGTSNHAGQGGDGQDNEPIVGKYLEDVTANLTSQSQTEGDLSAHGGWYKLVPMNLIALKTTSSTEENNSWQLTFTADDMIIVGKDHIDGNGLLSDILDSITDVAKAAASGSSSKFDSSKYLVEINDILSGQSLKDPYIPRRVSLKNNLFSVQDIVIPGDTVSIWLYNDPSEFLLAEDVGNAMQSGTFSITDFSEVIGSGTRKVQFQVGDSPESSELWSGIDSIATSAVINGKSSAKIDDDTAKSITLSIAMTGVGRTYFGLGGANYSSNIPDYSPISVDYNETTKVTKRFLQNGNMDVIFIHLQDNYPELVNGLIDVPEKSETDKVANHIKYNRAPTPKELDIANSMIAILTNPEIMDMDLKQIGEIKTPLGSGDGDGNSRQPKDVELRKLINRPASVNVAKIPPASVVRGLRYMKEGIESIATKKMGTSNYSNTSTISTASNSRGKISRSTLVSKEFGENCYLIMKGHVVAISTTVSAGERKITLTGAGFEHPINKSMIFYDGAQNGYGAGGVLQEHTSHLVNLNPAQQMVWYLTRFIPKQIVWSESTSSTDSITKEYLHPEELKENITKHIAYPPPDKLITRGMFVVDYDSVIQPTRGEDKKIANESKAPNTEVVKNKARIFTPLNFYNMARLGESLRAYMEADPTGKLANTTFPLNTEDRVTIMSMIKQLAGVSTIMEFFVDNVGQLMYRVSAEAWERTPRPEYTPNVDEESTISFTFTESEENVITVQDVSMQSFNVGGSSGTNMGRYNLGRGIARNGGIPFKSAPSYTYMKGTNHLLSGDMFRYGLRYNIVNDVFGADTRAARDKAHTIHRFYGQPIKRAQASVVANPSYRVGDTVYVHLPSHKKRMSVRRPVAWLRSWINNLKGDPDYLDMYVGTEGRFELKNAYFNSEYKPDSEIKYRPKEEIADKILKTLDFMDSNVSGPISWELFPTTAWYYLENKNRDPDAAAVLDAYAQILRAASRGEVLTKVFPHNILRKVRFNNFISMQFYIDGVSHSYEYPSQSKTDLTLSYGADCICLIHPNHGKPIGFFCVGRKIKDLDTVDEWENKEIPSDSEWRKLFLATFKQDRAFREGSFVYQSSKVRNTANYLHQLATQAGQVGNEGYITDGN